MSGPVKTYKRNTKQVFVWQQRILSDIELAFIIYTTDAFTRLMILADRDWRLP